MRHALRLAHRQLGRVWPNPAVGALVVRDQQVIGLGATASGGRPHAETLALAMAGDAAQGATLYVTLEPCAHQGATPPCVDTIIHSGIAHVVVATGDPDPRTNGKGITALQAAGITVTQGIERDAAMQLNEGFFRRVLHQRPLIALKLATTLDGALSHRNGESQWITGEPARAYGHGLRAHYDAILTGIGTVLADNPTLTCRLNGLSTHSPVRIVLDTHLRIPPDAAVIHTLTDSPVWIVTTAPPSSEKATALTASGITLLHLPCDATGRLDLAALLEQLAARGLTRILVEAGSTLTTAFLAQQLADLLYWFRAPSMLGTNGIAAIGDLAIDRFANRRTLTPVDAIMLGHDQLEVYRISPCLQASSPISAS